MIVDRKCRDGKNNNTFKKKKRKIRRTGGRQGREGGK
jgi:hypothetical protein